MTVGEALKTCCRTLADAGLESAALDAEVLLAFVLDANRSTLLQSPERILTNAELDAYMQLTRRRARREPVAYLTGQKMFYGRAFTVSRDVLIPRPESELLIETCLKTFPASKSLTIADIGTGSGCLAITLALEYPHAKIIATDISDVALKVARRNAELHNVSGRITFAVGDMLEPIGKETLDCIIANLPYVPNEELAANPDLAFEPIIALRGAHTPQKTYRHFFEQLRTRTDHPTTLIEIHPNLREFVERESAHSGTTTTFIKDLAGKDRVAVIQTR